MAQNATTGQLPAVVTIQDLPTGSTITGSELLEAVQTVNGVALSIQVPISQVMTTALGGLPTGGGTGQILNKTSGSSFAATWSNVTQFVAVGTGLATSGAATSIVVALANATALSVLGVAGTTNAPPAAIPGTADQVLVVNHAGTAVGFGPVNLATSAAVTGILAGANMSAVNLAASGAGGVQGQLSLATGVAGVLPVANGGQGTSTLTAHAVLLGEGAATLGFAAIATAGNLLIDQGAGNDPAFKTMSGDAAIASTGAATVTGLQARALLSTAPTTSQVVQWNGVAWAPGNAVTNVSTGWGLAGGPLATSGTLSIATSNPPYGFDTAVNLQLNASTSGNALTIAVKGNNGSDPSAANPVLFPFRDVLTSGAPVWRLATAALSITINQTATLGAASGSPLRVWITAHDTGTTPTLGVINCVVGMPSPTQVVALAQHTLQTTTAISSAAVTAGLFYSGVAVGNRPFLILGYLEYATMSTAGQWINTPTQIQLFGPGIKKPADLVQTTYTTTSAQASTISTTFTATGFGGTITPQSPVNLIKVTGSILAGSVNATTGCFVTVRRGTSTNIGQALNMSGGTNMASIINFLAIDAPSTTAATGYNLYFSSQTTGNAVFCPITSWGTPLGIIQLDEVMG